MSEILDKARDYENNYGALILEADRPSFHLSPTVGWMNDPNGFSCYKGEYHLFYQYHPYSTEWGPMHWGHAKTKDFLHWDRLPAALAPDMPYDNDGCFSGSAVTLPDGRHMLVYTGVQKYETQDGHTEQRQTQCLAIGDGENYEKYDCNPVLTHKDLPEGGSAVDFRDPKAWREEDGSYRLVVGNRCADDSGAVLLYRSENGLDWTLVGEVDNSGLKYGQMWECPDFFPLDGKQVMMVSPQDMKAIGMEFHAGNGTVCLIGSYDKETNSFVRENVQAIDYGIDFYAPQTLETEDGRRIMIGWLQNWNTLAGKPRGCRWFGQMAIPREISIHDGRLIQNPVRELESYRKNPLEYRDVLIDKETTLQGVEGRKIDMTLNIRPAGKNSYSSFCISLAKDSEHATTIQYRPETNTMKIDRSLSGCIADVVHTRSFLVRPDDGILKLRIVMDKFSVEVFVNDGEHAASVAIFTHQDAASISFDAIGSVLLDLEKYDIDL